MEFVSIFAALRRGWLLVLPGVLVAVFAALFVMFHISSSGLSSRRQVSSVAAAHVLVSASNAPVFDLDSSIGMTLPTRAILIADLLSTDASEARIATLAGVPAGQLIVIGPAGATPEVEVPIAVSANDAASAPLVPYVVHVSAAGGTVPIITIRANAADPRMAAKVASAVVKGIQELIEQKSGDSSAPAIKADQLGLVSAKAIVTEPKPPIAVIAAILVLGFWCSGVVVVMGLGRRWAVRRSVRAAAAAV
jgi:hypothetical protein